MDRRRRRGGKTALRHELENRAADFRNVER
jgi:hypothetical protein